MKSKSKKVTSNKQELGTIEIPQCETIAEAVQAYGEAVCLDLINRQKETDMANDYRREKTGGVSGLGKLGKVLSDKIKTFPEDVQQQIAAAAKAGDQDRVVEILMAHLTA